MTPSAVQDLPAEVLSAKIRDLIAAQQRYFESGATRSVDFRLRQLKSLRAAIRKNAEAIQQALKTDLGKAPFEAYVTEVGFVLEELSYILKHLRTWAKPESVGIPITNAISTGYIYSEPYGRALVIAPWNYPFQLACGPLLGSIAAGNCTLLKPSENTPATSAVMARLISETFPSEYIAVVEGGVETNQALLAEQHDYIFFTGSTQVGRIVMQAAARHLTPVTLELGGKSPCIIDERIDLANTARRVAWGKFLNCGQTCVAPDYLLVHEKVRDRLLPALKKNIEQFYGPDPLQSPDYSRIVNDRHYQRLKTMLAQGEIYHGGQTDDAQRFIGPTLLLNPDPEAPVMQEEIFGPILPILFYSNLEEAIRFANSKGKPLALYVFTNSSKVERRILESVPSGGACVNETVMHLASPELPFGGVGASGMGSYHGKYSFEAFSHRRSVLKKSNLLDIRMRYAPYKNKLKLVKRMMK